jgi:ABC-2 type transport system permease protein
VNAIYILWLRQLKRHLRSRARVIGSLGQPLLFLVALGFGFGPIYRKAGGGNYLQFLAPGIIAMAILFSGMFAGIEVIWDRQFGFLKETLVAPVSRTAIMVGRTFGGATVALIQGIIVLIMAIVVGFRPVSWAPIPLALGFMFLVGFLFTAFGTALASVLEDMQGFQIIMNFLIMPVFFLSGALFPLAGVPRGIAIASTLDPLSYGVDALRAILVGSTHFGVLMDLGVLLGVSAVVLVVGAKLFSRIQV